MQAPAELPPSPRGFHVLSSGFSRGGLGRLKHWLHRQLQLPILTADETIARYEVETIW